MELKKFIQYPYWKHDTAITILGNDLSQLLNISKEIKSDKLDAFIESILSDNIMSGVITVTYKDMDGNNISKDEMLAMYNEYLRLAQTSDSEPEL